MAQLQRVHPMPPAVRERFYPAFTVWDEVMADSVCEVFLRDRRPGLRMRVAAGRAHVEGGATGVLAGPEPPPILGDLPLGVFCPEDLQA